MRNTRKLFLLMFALSVVLVTGAGCAAPSALDQDIPKTAAEAGIATLDSTSCEGCHIDAEAILALAQPEDDAEEAAGGG